MTTKTWTVVMVMTIFVSLVEGEAMAQPSETQHEAETARIDVKVTGFRNTKGQALVALFTSKKGFPNKGKLALKQEAVSITGKSLSYTFEGLEPGVYAVAILHDENSNFKMDTGFFGIPKEGYCVSNNARNRFGPPDWEDARFRIGPGQVVRQTIKLIYH